MTGTFFVGGRRDGRVDVAVLVEMRVGEPDLLQFLGKQAAEILLLLGRGAGRGGGIGLGVDDDVAQEALGDVVLEVELLNSVGMQTAAKGNDSRGYTTKQRHSGGRFLRAGMTLL